MGPNADLLWSVGTMCEVDSVFMDKGEFVYLALPLAWCRCLIVFIGWCVCVCLCWFSLDGQSWDRPQLVPLAH